MGSVVRYCTASLCHSEEGSDEESHHEQAAKLIAQAGHGVVFPGADVSKEVDFLRFGTLRKVCGVSMTPRNWPPRRGFAEIRKSFGMLNVWWRFVRWGFTQLYTNFARAYDAVAWAVSRGQWKEWGQAALPRIKGARVLEIGSGPGHLLAAMVAEGYTASAIDSSPQMIRIAHRRLRRQGLMAGLVHGRAQALPWPNAYFDSVVMTFPAGFALHPKTPGEIRRVLCPGGCLVIVSEAWLRNGLYGRLVNLAFRITHGRGGATQSLRGTFEEAGFTVIYEIEHRPNSSVGILVATKI